MSKSLYEKVSKCREPFIKCLPNFITTELMVAYGNTTNLIK